MGRDKALIRLDGVALVDRMAGTLKNAGCAETVAIGPRRLAGEVDHVDDLHPGQGPLGGILTALDVAARRGFDRVIVVACDLIWLDSATLVQLVAAVEERDHAGPGARADVIVARSDRPEPLCALWSCSATPSLAAAFDSGRRAVHQALTDLETVEVHVSHSALRNANNPEDLGNE